MEVEVEVEELVMRVDGEDGVELVAEEVEVKTEVEELVAAVEVEMEVEVVVVSSLIVAGGADDSHSSCSV